MDLSLEEYKLYTDLIREKCGIYFDDKKQYFVKKRIEDRMRITNCNTFKDYYRLIKYDPRRNELDIFIGSLTTNETYFFRENSQLTVFADNILPLVLEEKRRNILKRLKIWSAACSTGCEPYTLAIILRERVPNIDEWDIIIHGTDICNNVLQTCRNGVYTERDVKDFPESYKEKYIENSLDGSFRVSQCLKKMTTFSHLNLVDKMAMRTMRDFDFIFCRNVLIYFDDEVRKNVVNMLYDSLRKGGYIFLGHADSMSRISAAFKVVKINNILAYRKE